MGTEPYLLASTLRCILSQRLVRVICRRCYTEYTPDESVVRELESYLDDLTSVESGPITLAYGKGCEHCFNTGYYGRSAIGELLETNDEIRDLAVNRAHSVKIEEAAVRNGMIPINRDGIRKVLARETTFEEVKAQTDIS